MEKSLFSNVNSINISYNDEDFLSSLVY